MPNQIITLQTVVFEAMMYFAELLKNHAAAYSATCAFCRSNKTGERCGNCGASENAKAKIQPSRGAKREELRWCSDVLAVNVFIPCDALLGTIDELAETYLKPAIESLYENLKQHVGDSAETELLFAEATLPSAEFKGGWMRSTDRDTGASLGVVVYDGHYRFSVCYGKKPCVPLAVTVSREKLTPIASAC
jgi:hypothetical protein